MSPLCSAAAARRRLRYPSHLLVELLESRCLLSTTGLVQPASLTVTGSPPFTPAELRRAYGIDQITLNGAPGDGRGQTIAIVDAYDNPAFVNSTDPNFLSSDLHLFDLKFGLPDPPSFQKVGQTGTSALPGTDPAGPNTSANDWEGETALDIEWAHAIAPGANILLVEANSSSVNDIFAAVDAARHLPDVSVVSMSFGSGFEFPDQATRDTTFTTPAGHRGVTFVASSGDAGAPGGYAAFSPNVLAAGGTTLTLSSTGAWQSEQGWSNSGGGISQVEPLPAYQNALLGGLVNGRAIPDISFVADPYTGVYVYDSYNNPHSPLYSGIGGTSLASPSWAGLVAIVDQGRASFFQGSYDGATQLLPALYQRSASDFHDITVGFNGYSAGPGYDLVTGLGSPVANKLIPDLAMAYPVGHLDSAANTSAPVLAGWAYANDLGTAADSIQINVDGTAYRTLAANLARPDLPAALPSIQGPNHGFSVSLAGLAAGTHTVDVYALDAQGNVSTYLGRQTVTTAVTPSVAAPAGYLDTRDGARPANASTLLLSGWAYDPAAGTGPATVKVYVDGTLRQQLTANLARPDVPAALPDVQGPNHGFSTILSGLARGAHTVDVYVTNATGTTYLGRQTAINAGPIGYLDTRDGQPASNPASLLVAGWAYDPGQATGPATVQILIDGTLYAQFTASTSRPDVPAALPLVLGPNHGFARTLSGLRAGRHQVQVFAVDTLSMSLLGTQTVQV